MKTCRDCGNLEGCIAENNKQNCELNPDFEGEKYCEGFVERKPTTNADRIRAMTDEELAWVFHIVAHCEDWGSCERCIFHSLYSCVEEDILEWLQQLVEGER